MSSNEDRYLFLDLPPYSQSIEYFDALASNGPLYMTVWVGENQEPVLFVEKSTLKGRPDTFRVFYRKDDIRRYITTMAATNKADETSFRAWETDFSHLADMIPKLHKNMMAKGDGGVHAITTIVHRNRFHDLDVFWTAEPSSMV